MGTFDPLQDRCPTGGLVTMTDHTAVGVRVALNTGFHAARARLRILVKGGTLPRASEVAYGEGINGWRSSPARWPGRPG